MKFRISALLVVVALLVVATVLMTSAATPPDYTADLVWTNEANRMAVCPACGGEAVQWTPLTSYTEDYKTVDPQFYFGDGEHYHFYVPDGEDTVVINTKAPKNASDTTDGFYFFMYLNGSASGTDMTAFPTVCLHLNGNNLKTHNMAYINKGTFNLMGSGTWTGGGSSTTNAAVVNVSSYLGVANLYGNATLQTVQTKSGDERYPAVAYSNAYPDDSQKGRINIKGVTINNGIRMKGGIIEMESGTVNGGVTMESIFYSNTTKKYTRPWFKLKGGTVNGRVTGDSVYSGNGGAFRLSDGARLEVSGGTINGCAVSGNGGAIYAKGASSTTTASDSSTVTPDLETSVIISGGTINGGSAVDGGAIYATYGTLSDGTERYVDFQITGGTITGGIASNNGGNIAVVGSDLLINGSSVIEEGNATKYGGNVYMDGTYDGSTANLYLAYDDSSNQSETTATIRNGDSGDQGGNLYITQAATARIGKNGLVSGGETEKDGGNIAIAPSSSIYIYGSVQSGIAKGNGGNLAVAGSGCAYIDGGLVDNGKAYKNGGNIYAVDANTMVYMSTGEVSGGTAENGDNIYLDDLSEMNLFGGTVYGTDGAEKTAGEAIAVNNAILRLGGNAKVLRKDGKWGGLIQLADTCGKLHVLTDWTGEAGVTSSVGYMPLDSYDYELPQHSEDYNAEEDNLGILLQCGTYDANAGTFTKGGSFSGILHCSNSQGGPGIKAKNNDGVLWVASVKVLTSAGEDWAFDPDQLLTNGAAVTLELYEDNTELTLNNNALTLNVNGKNVTLAGTGTLAAYDTANDTYQDFGTVSFASDANITYDSDVTVDGKRYLTVEDSLGNISSHRVNVSLVNLGLRISGDSLEDIGYYYKALYEFDDTLKGLVDKFGVVTSAKNMPGEYFDSREDLWTEIDAGENDFSSGMLVNSGLIYNILQSDADAEDNEAYGTQQVYVNPYIVFKLSKTKVVTVLEDTENAGSTENGFSMSLKDVMVTMDSMMDNAEFNMPEATKTALKKFYTKWADKWFSQWKDDLPNMSNTTVL